MSASLRRFLRPLKTVRDLFARRKTPRTARPAFRPWLETLEDRLAPAVDTLNLAGTTLTFQQAANDSATLSGIGNSLTFTAGAGNTITTNAAAQANGFGTGGNSTTGSYAAPTAVNTINILGNIGNTFTINTITNPIPTLQINALVGTTNLNTTLTTQNGANFITFSAAINLTGPTSITAGTNGNVTFNGTVNGAQTLTTSTSGTGNTTFQNSVGNNTALTSVNVTGSTTLHASVTTTGTQTYSGNETLTANATLTGTTLSLNGAALALGGNTLTLANSAPSTIGAGTTITGTAASGLTVNGSSTLTVSAGGAGFSGPTTVAGGTLVLNSGTFNNSPVSVTGGVLQGSGTVTSITTTGGTVEPGQNGNGTLTANSASTFNGATYQADVNGATAGALSDGNTVTLTGSTLNVNTITAPTAPSYTIITGTSIIGTFSNAPAGVPVNFGGTFYTVTYNPGSVVLTPIQVTRWKGGAGANGNKWSIAGNWTNGVPGNGATAIFDNSTPGFVGGANGFNPVNDIAGLSGITIQINNNSGTAFNLTGDAIGLSGITNNTVGGGGPTINFATGGGITLSGPATFSNTGAQGMLVSSTINTNGNLLTDSGGLAQFNGVVSGTGGLTVGGNGALLLGAANTYTGATTINAGTTISVLVANALPTGTALTDNGTLELGGNNQQVGSITGTGKVQDSGGAATLTVNNAAADTFAGTIISANTRLTAAGAGTLTLTNAGNTYGGATTINVGSTLQDGVNNALPTTTTLQVGGTFDLAGFNQQVAGMIGTGTVIDSGGAATLTFNNAAFDNVLGTITGANTSLVAAGTGTLLLSSGNTYGGTTTINAGATIQEGTTNALPSTTALTDNGTLDLMGNNQTVSSLNGVGMVIDSGGPATLTINNAGTDNFSGTITGANTSLTAAGTAKLILGAANTYGGTTTINAGALIQDGVANAVSTNSSVTDNGTLDLNSKNQQVAGLTGTGTVSDSGAGAVTLTVSNAAADSFGGTITGANVSLTAGGTATLTLTNAGNTYGGSTTINAGATLQDGVANALPTGTALTDNGTLDLMGFNQQVSSLAGIGMVIDSGGAATLTVNNAAADSFGGTITGANTSLTKNGAGTLTLTAANTYGGSTTINPGGTLQDGITNALPTGTALTINAATLDLMGFNQTVSTLVGTGMVIDSGGPATLTINNAGTDNYGGVISGANTSLTKSGAGTLTLTNLNTYGGSTTISAGTLAINIANSLPTGTALTDNGTLDLNGKNQQVASITGSGVVTDTNGAATFTVNNAAADSFAGTITGANTSLSKTGAGTFTLTAANTYGGTTTIGAGGTLQDGIANALPTGTALTDNGILDLMGFNQQVSSLAGIGMVIDSGGPATLTVNSAAADSFGGLITGANTALTDSGAGTLTLTAANTYGGTTTINAGSTIADGIANALPTGTALTDNGTLDLAGFNQQVASVTGTGTVIDSGAAVTFTVNNAVADSFGGTITGANTSLSKTGAGTFTLTAASTYGGSTTIAAGGTLQDGIANALPTGTALTDNGILDLMGFNQTVASLAGIGMVIDSGGPATLTVNSAAADSFGGLITGANTSLTDSGAGTLTLTAANTYGGTTTIAAGATIADGIANALPTTTNVTDTGTLDLAGFNQQIGDLSGAGTITDSAAAATLNVSGSGTTTFSGTISNALSLTRSGTGTLTLSGNNPGYTGTTSVQAGTLAVNGNDSGTPVTVTGGTLAGTGTVKSITATSGIISPAGSGTVGTLTSASGAFGSTINGATYQVDVNNGPASDQLVIGNGATINLNGGTLNVNVLASTGNNVYTLVSSASGGISGTFTGLVDGTDFSAGGRFFRIHYTANAVTLTDVAATSLKITQQPTSGNAGSTLTPALVVQVLDQNGTVIQSDNNQVITVALGANPGNGTLGGTLTATTVNGVATFSNLSINAGGSGYTLAVSSTGLSGAISNAINVTGSTAPNNPTNPTNPTTLPLPPSVQITFTPDGQEVTLVVTSSGQLFQYDLQGTHLLATGVRSASVAFGGVGEVMDVVFLSGGQLYQFDITGTHQLQSGVSTVSVAITPDGQVVKDVVFQDGRLVQMTTAGTVQLATGVHAAGLAFGAGGEVTDVVFADGSLFQYDLTGTHLLATGASTVGVGITPSGLEVMDLFFANDALVQFNPFSSKPVPLGTF